jgi:hypothetical protein
VNDDFWSLPIFWPFYGLAVLVLVPVVLLLPAELAYLVALVFTTSYRATVYGGIAEGAAIALVLLGMLGEVVLDED